LTDKTFDLKKKISIVNLSFQIWVVIYTFQLVYLQYPSNLLYKKAMCIGVDVTIQLIFAWYEASRVKLEGSIVTYITIAINFEDSTFY
jgi:hypothetical protein